MEMKTQKSYDIYCRQNQLIIGLVWVLIFIWSFCHVLHADNKWEESRFQFMQQASDPNL